MSNEEASEPRRGARSRKQVERFDPSTGKHRSASDSGNDSSDLSDSDGDDAATAPRKRQANGTRGPRAKRAKAAPKTVPITDIDRTDGFKTDSPLFNALLQPDVALQPLVEDWVHNYNGTVGDEEAERAAIHELVLFLIRACGLSADVDEHVASDLDGTTDAVDTIQEQTVQTNAASYPLISRSKAIKPFKSNLATVVQHLVTTLSLTPHLFEDNQTTKHSQALMPLLMAWLLTMSSSPLRPIRHTATFIALKINTALCDCATTVSKELSLKQRQKEAEAKKGGAAAKKRVAEAEEKVKQAHEKKVTLEGYMDDLDKTMFVHRVRDADPAIRIDCLRELGVWLKRYPEKYTSTSHLNDFVRGTNDPDSGARLETVKALAGLFSNPSVAGNLGSFTLRIAPRLIQMASVDVETSVRSTALQVLFYIDRTGALEDDADLAEERNKVARLIFDVEPRIRKAAAPFVRGLWDERAEALSSEFNSRRAGKKQRASKIAKAELQQRFVWKALASLLVSTSQSLDDPDDAPSSSAQPMVITPSTSMDATTRPAAAAEALWQHLWESKEHLIEYLLLDHSTSDEDPWLLTDEEEDFLLGMLITCIKRDDVEDLTDERTKELMKVVPRLFTKHQAEPGRIAGILSIPEHMNLSLYLDMRKSTAYEALWDDVTKQFLHHTDPIVLTAAIQAINALSANTSMDTINSTKIAELEESLFASLRDAINGEDVGGMSIDEDQLGAIEAIFLRLSLLARSRDITTVMSDEEGGQSSGWTIVSAFAGRGGLGFKEEAKLVEYALQIVFLHLMWLVANFTEEDGNDESKVDALKERRDQALELFDKYGVRDRTNAAEAVRRQAFIAFINLHMLFSNRSAEPKPAARLAVLDMPTDKQHKLGGAFQAVVERYASDLEDSPEEDEDDLSLASAQREVVFLQLVAVFVGAVRCGVLDVELAKEPLAHYGRFGSTYDALVKKLVDVLRDEGIFNKQADTVQHVVSEALQNSFTTFMESEDEEPDATTALARLAASAFVVHGTHFTVLKQIRPDDVCDLHIASIDWLFRKVSSLVKQQVSQDSREGKGRVATQRARVLLFLRPLALLLGPIAGRDALRIRTHLEKAVDDTGAANQIRSAAPYRAYEKRLVAIAGKDSGLKVAQKKAAPTKSKQTPEVVESESGEEEEEPEQVEAVEDAEVTQEDIEQADEPMDGSQPPTTPSKKRPLPESDELSELEFDPGNITMDLDEEIDMAFGDTPIRNRSVSTEPTAKRTKGGRKF